MIKFSPQRFFVGESLNPEYVRSESSIAREIRRKNRYKEDPEEMLTLEIYIKYAGLHEVTPEEAFTMYESASCLYDNVALSLIYAAGLEIPDPPGNTNDAVRLCEKAIEILGFRKAKYQI